MLQTDERRQESTGERTEERTTGLPRPADAQRQAGSRPSGLVLALLLFGLAATIVVLLWFGVSLSAGAAGGCGGG